MEDSNGEGKSQDGFMATPTKDQNPADPSDIYENRKPKKIIRVVTVMAYLLSVSFVGILLSAYYIFLWEPPNPRLMQRQRLRTDPQMQFLIAQPSEETDSTKKDGSFLPQSEVNRVHKPLLLGRMSQDIYDDDDSVVDPRDKMDLEKKRRLNMILLNLRHSLVDTLRAQNRSLSRETAISNRLNNSFVKVGKVLNSTMGRAENSISRNDESRRGNTSEKETYNGNADLPPEFANSTSTLDVESTSSTSKFTTIPGTETSQTHFDRDPVTNATPITEEKNHKKKLDELYLVRGFDNVTANSDVTNGSNQRVFGDNNSFKMTKEFRKIDREEPRQNKTDDRRWNNDEENDLGDVQTSVILEDRVNGSIRDPHQKNYSNDSESSSKDQIGQITRDTVSIDPSSRNLGFTDDPGFHQTPDYPTVIKSQPRTTGTRNSEETQIERMIARSTTIDNKQLEQIDLSTTQRQKSFSEIFTEVADVEETSVELTSISTTRDYHNFTSITSEDDESVT